MDTAKKVADWAKNHIILTVVIAMVVIAGVVAGGVLVIDATSGNQDASVAQQAFLQGDYATAIEEFTALIDSNPRNPAWYIGRGTVYVTVENFANAQRDFETALALEPETDDLRPYRELGYIYAANDNPQQAIEYLNIVMDSDTEALAADYTARGFAYATLLEPDLEAALTDLEFAADLSGTSPETFVYLADIHYELGNQADALENYTLYQQVGGQLGDVGLARVAELEAAVDE